MSATRSSLPNQLLPGRAAGYEWTSGHLENRDPIQPHTGRGLGDIATTVGDMARWEAEQRAPRLISAESARRARTPVLLNDGSVTDYGYGWFTHPVAGEPALSHEGQTAGFVSSYARLPQRDLALVVLTNLYGAPVNASAILRLVEPALAGPPLVPATQHDAQRTEQVRAVLAAAGRASSAWRAEWFSPTYWAGMHPHLAGLEATYQRRGRLLTLSAVGLSGLQDAAKPQYRAVFEHISRLITVEFDVDGRIESMRGEDE